MPAPVPPPGCPTEARSRACPRNYPPRNPPGSHCNATLAQMARRNDSGASSSKQNTRSYMIIELNNRVFDDVCRDWICGYFAWCQHCYTTPVGKVGSVVAGASNVWRPSPLCASGIFVRRRHSKLLIVDLIALPAVFGRNASRRPRCRSQRAAPGAMCRECRHAPV
ncbi:MAG: hypothetical protein JWM91_4736 [Rhodospirillales bacterium]|nr:hypothetical protein [Rhodospirillales bacterium]